MSPDTIQQLQRLRGEVLQELVGLSEYMANDEGTSYELLLTLARNTGDQQLLDKAFAKIKTLEDPKQKSDALLALLDEVELGLSTPSSNDQPSPTDEPSVSEPQQ